MSSEPQLSLEDYARAKTLPPDPLAPHREIVAENPDLWVAFIREALRVKRAGRDHYSARTIFHVLRHHSAIDGRPEDSWKVNNNASRSFALVAMADVPELAGFFATRSRRGVSE